MPVARNVTSRRSSSVGRILDSALSLHCKAIVIGVLVMLTVTATLSGYFLEANMRIFRGRQSEQVAELAAMLARSAAVMPFHEGSEALATLALKSANGAPLEYVLFFDGEEREVASAHHGKHDFLHRFRKEGMRGASTIGISTVLPADDRLPATVDITYPVASMAATEDGRVPGQTKLAGYVRVGMVVDTRHRSVVSIGDLAVGVAILATIVTVPIGLMLVRRVVSPLESLTQTMVRFSQGELTIRSPVNRRDEIGRLAEAFNRMADQYQQDRERLVRFNEQLEERVSQRTHQLRELASREPLTGLYNRRHFSEALQQELSEAIRYETDLSCIMMDLDNFKQANDRFGHQVGDEVLLLVSSTILSQLRSSDVAARFGGDEFVLMLPRTDVERAGVLADRISERFEKELTWRLPQVRVGMSIGIASLRESRAHDVDTLIRAADRALYQAKEGGKNRIVSAVSRPAPTASGSG
ncbi:MAG: diguanylate cyclase [Planctomycetota bacterium]